MSGEMFLSFAAVFATGFTIGALLANVVWATWWGEYEAARRILAEARKEDDDE